jgi:predicted glycosyltransferase
MVANDGFSAGHVTRTIAIARALERRSRARNVPVRIVLATTSEADSLLAGESFAVVRLPAPLAARRAGFGDSERRRLVRGTLHGACEAFGPDLIVCDTFPSGPHGELTGIGAERAKRALVRRAVRTETGDDEVLTAGLRDHDLAIVADDPVPICSDLPIPTIRVPPITLAEAEGGKDRDAARDELGLPLDGRVVLVAAGGGGDSESVKRAVDLAEAIARLDPSACVVRAVGPLERSALVDSARSPGPRLMRVAPLQPLLSAFDVAFAPAGYNTAHELAKAGVRAALFAQPRPFDDQAARATRFAEQGLAIALERFDDDAIAAALEWTKNAPRPTLEAGGADRAADALVDLATGERATERAGSGSPAR